MIESLLKQQGLTSKEISVLTCLMENGELPASVLARRVEISRSSCYSIIEKLIDRGFISQIKKNDTTYFKSLDHQRFLNLVKNQLTQEIQQINNFESYLQKARTNENQPSPTSRAHYFSGLNGLNQLIDSLTDLNSESTRILLSSELSTHPTLNYLHLKIAQNKFPNCQLLQGTNDDTWDNSPLEILQKHFFTIIRTGFSLIILDNHLAIISFEENFGILIDSPHLAQMQGNLFNYFWRIS